MNTETKKTVLRNWTIFLFIVLTVFCRLINIIPNFSPLGASALFGGAYLEKKYQALLIPILSVWLSDLFINNVLYSGYFSGFVLFYNGFYWQYGSYILTVFIGIYFLKKPGIIRIITAAISASLVFFLISNFGCWIGSPVYPQNFGGLISCYIAGLPFIKGTLLGNLFYSAVIFSSFHFLEMQFPKLQPVIRHI